MPPKTFDGGIERFEFVELSRAGHVHAPGLHDRAADALYSSDRRLA